MLVCTIGDLLLDVVIRLEGPVAFDTDTYGRTYTGAGGQAANVAAWTAELGGEARFIGKRARDPAGLLVAAELRRRGVDVVGPEVERGTGTVVSVATPDGGRTMLSDRGVAADLAPGELESAWLVDCDWLHVPGYSLARPPLREAAIAAARRARLVSVDASSTAVIEALGPQAYVEAIGLLRPSVVFANEDEIGLLPTLSAPTLVVKRGARGCVVRRDGETAEHAAVPAQPLDSTGAGDAFAAGFLLGGPELALGAAARCVGSLGAMP